VRPEEVNSLRKLSAPKDMPVSGGVEHRKAPERLPDCSKNPMGAVDLSRSAGSRIGVMPWGAAPKTSWFAQTSRVEAREGTSGGESSRDDPGVTCSEGDSVALGPWPWNQGGQAQVPSSRRSFRPRIPQSSRLWSTADDRAQQMRQRISAFPLERAPRVKSQERQRTQRVRRAGER
jgi:hypothetical protein